MRVELFGLGGRERSGSFWAVGGGSEALEDLVGPCGTLWEPVGDTLRQHKALEICSLR